PSPMLALLRARPPPSTAPSPYTTLFRSRTAMLQTLCLPTDEKDPDVDTYERSAAPSGMDELLAAVDEIGVPRSAFASWVITPQGWSTNVQALDDAQCRRLASRVRSEADVVRAGVEAVTA